MRAASGHRGGAASGRPGEVGRTHRRGGPVAAEELAGLFGVLGLGERAVLAVSGGCDSTALMVLFADWLAANMKAPASHAVVTVDHRLRPGSAAEAQRVAHRATALGFGHQTLVWEGDKPASGLQAAARAARYRLLGAYALGQGMDVVMTGHTADDQAETLLMRLARGSGLDGLAAMAPATSLAFAQCSNTAVRKPPPLSTPALPGKSRAHKPGTGRGVRLVRPLLDVPRARLRATLEARGIAWQEDPSNSSPAFERTRIRAASSALASLGLTRDSLILSARRLQRARVALERAVDEFCDPRRALLAIAPCGFMCIDAAALRGAPREIGIRVLLRAISAVGGGGGHVPLAKLEAVASGICACERGAWTLARAQITAGPAHVHIVREAGRVPLPRVVLAGGAEALWDGRFLVRVRGAVTDIEVRALGAEGVRAAAAAGGECPAAPRRALHCVPAFYRDGSLIAAPHLAYWAAPDLRRSLSAVFAPLCSCNISAWVSP